MCHTADQIRLVKVPDQNLFIFCAIKANESFPELFVESFLSAVAIVDGGQALKASQASKEGFSETHEFAMLAMH